MRFLKLAGVLAIMLCATRPARAANPAITFNNQVIRIFQQQCQSCHRPDNIAPFSLLTYRDALTHATAIKTQIQSKAMPPWKPVNAKGSFEGERMLTDLEIQTIVKWIDEGMIEGSSSDLPEPIKFPAIWTYNTPDVVVEPSTAYQLNPAGGEIYRCFTMPVTSAVDLNVRGYEVLPGNREIVHHVLLFVDKTRTSAALDAADPGPGYTCFGSPGFIPDTALGGWVPGMTPEIFPLGVGVTVPANSTIVMQIHYSPLGHISHPRETDAPPAPDKTKVGLFLSPAKLRPVDFLPVVNPFFSIPAGEKHYQVTAFLPIPTAVELTAVTPHMHLLGREVLVEARFPNGSTKELVHITDWDFEWQATYTLKQPVLLPAGTIVTSKAWYDNSAGNPRNPSSPPIPVRWGERTTDEMCLTFLSVTAPGARSMTEVPFTISDRGGTTINGTGEAAATTVGYARLTPQPGNPTAEGLAIFGFRQNNVLVTETAVSATTAVTSGRIFAETNGPVNSGVAIANPSADTATLTFYFTDSAGTVLPSGTTTIPPGGQIASFLDEKPFSGPKPFIGSFTFTSTKPVSVVALRGTVNERGEFLLTTLPVAPLSATTGASLVFPHYADGGGWQTQILLVNPSDVVISGTYRFVTPAGATVGNPTSYAVPPRSVVRYQTPGTGATVSVGSVRFTPATSSPTPSGSLVFSFRSNGVRVTEAGVPSIPEAKAFRIYVESSENGTVQSGVAIANPSGAETTVTLELTNLNGSAAARTTVTIPANGQFATFLNQIPGFENIRLPFQGVLRIASSTNLSAIGLRGRYNERSDFLITTTAPVTESLISSANDKYFAHFVNGGGYTTQFIVFRSAAEPNGGTILFYSNTGQANGLSIH